VLIDEWLVVVDGPLEPVLCEAWPTVKDANLQRTRNHRSSETTRQRIEECADRWRLFAAEPRANIPNRIREHATN
jgi:hypothetical protein